MKAFTERALPLLALLGLAVAGCGGTGETGATVSSPSRSSVPVTSPPLTTPAPTTPAPATTTSASASTSEPAPGGTLIAGRYQPLWPFSGPGEAAAWQRSYQANGTGKWHLDAGRTAVAFSRDFLGFKEIDRAVKTVEDGAHARVHVGFRAEEGPKPLVAAVVHLMRYGGGKDAPWEVVGTDDTTLTLTTPRYGATASSPLTVGGRISGVDESIRIQIYRPGTAKPLGERCCVAAGGTNSPWSGRVTFTARPGRTLTVVASTGGHIATVERFAVTGVTVPG
ncbi:hypothetical protein SAMN05444920_114138 [Nonomuraea solani]|uniref:Uncharacterized protein n=1 Tax=Nonomuraea solani TaxID=1144553 RepID=A0A1H6EPW1_9ACTN|nr:hypothetical protein [Nonomuraea solani]SEG99862.1 hypothetical protein SAMN05444920_114138 [Nonomuraea solani]